MRSCRSCPNTEEQVPFVKGKNQCKICYNAWFREYYRKNEDKREANRTLVSDNRPNRKQRNRDLVNSHKRNKPCTDCGNTFHPAVMDYDHLSDKIAGIAHMVSNCWSEENILEEMTKCELVCANCHRIRTFKRQFGEEVYEQTK